MAWHWEVKSWDNGERIVRVFETEKQAVKRAAAMNAERAKYSHLPNRIGPAVVSSCCSTHDLIKEFREIRKREFNGQDPATPMKAKKGGAA